MSRTRDWRRAQKDRYANKARHFLKDVVGIESIWDLHKSIYRRTSTRCPCSSWCCGNPRKHFNAVSFQEARFSCSSEDDLNDLGIRRKNKNDPKY